MIEDDFYATIKLKSGEEIFAKVAASEEVDRTMLLITNPIVLQEIRNKINNSIIGYKIESWLKTTNEDMFVINLNDVLTMSESSNVEMIMMYQDYIRHSQKTNDNESKINRRMGYIANVHDAKELLEKIFNKNHEDLK